MRWLFCFLLLVGQTHAELLNGSFERINKDRVPVGWTPVPDSAQVVAERSNAHGGKAMAHLLVEQAGQTVGLMSNPVSVQAGAVYVLTGWASTRGQRAVAQVRWLSDNQTVVGTEKTTEITVESWAQLAGTFVAPEQAVACRVFCLAEGGSAFFDDMVLDKISGPMAFDLHFDAAVLPARGKRSVSMRITVEDSAGGNSANGAVVVFEADRGQIDSWVLVKNRTATVTLANERVGGIWVRARLANFSARVYVGDEKAARLQGRMYHADTGHPLSGRVLIADSLGSVWSAGFGREQGLVSEGMFHVDLPPGKVTVSARRGLTELSPEPQFLDLVAGEEQTVELPFRPWIDMKAQGWWGGDFAAGEEGGLSAHARGLDWAALPNDSHRERLQTFLGEMVENRWGDQWVLGVVGQKDASVPGFEIQAQVHRDRGIVGYAYGAHKAPGLVFDVLAGPTFDALDVVFEQDASAQNLWFALLNRGYRVAGTAFSGNFQTYTQVAGELTADRLLSAIANGHNMMTNGPLLLFSVFAAGPGSELPAGRKRRATIRAWAAADAGAYLTRIELIRNAEVMQSWDLEEQSRKHRITVVLEDSVDCWYVARCYGADSTQVALTNPIFFRTEDFTPPEPVQAVVRGIIETADSSAVPNAVVRVIDPLGKVVLETVARDGAFQVWAPATSQIQVQAKGFQVAAQRIFDHKGIQGVLQKVGSTPLALSGLDALDALAEQLQAVEMVFVLNR